MRAMGVGEECFPIAGAQLRREQDVVGARQRALQIAHRLGYDTQQCTRLATAVSEIARNAVTHGVGGTIDFELCENGHRNFVMRVRDAGPGIGDLEAMLSERKARAAKIPSGIVIARRLVDTLTIEPDEAGGTSVTLVSRLPSSRRQHPLRDIALRARGTRGDAAMEDRAAKLSHSLAALEQARTEADTQAQAARALQHIADGVLLVDNDGTIVLANAAAQDLLRGGRLAGRPISDAISAWAEVSGRVCLTEPGMRNPRVRAVPLSIAGAEYWLCISGTRLDEGVVYVLRDVTDERQLERLRSDMVSTVSHELRTPLTSIHASAITLQRDDIQLSPGTSNQLVELIRQGSERLAKLVDELLLANRLDAGQLEVAAQQVELAPLIASALHPLVASMPESIEVQVDVEPGVCVTADEGRLEQVLTNLVENAIKYSPDGGTITIRTYQSAGQVAISVTDEGLGIEPAAHQRIFEKFYRVDPGMRHGISGTGLGLYITSELVERMQGRITVMSSPGQGSTFTVVLAPAECRGTSTAESGASML